MSQSDATTAVDNAPDHASEIPTSTLKRRDSTSQQSETSQTAADFIRDQIQLEADAREALPYSSRDCTKSLGALRQSVFSCLTCNPPPADPTAPYNAAGVCYSCSIQCHGEHTLVEIFSKRNVTCDCGTTRFPAASPCSLRENPATGAKGVHSEPANADNKYNQNFRNKFCGCEGDYDPFQQKGTMYQCLGLGTHETGGCGEDWWHPGCLVGLGPKWFETMEGKSKIETPANGAAASAPENKPLPTIAEEENAPAVDSAETEAHDEEDEPPMPPNFPEEDSFETFLCYKCVDANPWVKRYAGTPGFLPAVFSKQPENPPCHPDQAVSSVSSAQKRKAEDEGDEDQESKRHKSEEISSTLQTTPSQPNEQPADVKDEPAAAADKPACKLTSHPPAPTGQISIFLKEDFRDHLCRCGACFPLLKPHPQLLEEEETYEPPVSEDGSEHGGSTQGSLLELGENALRGMDRVRAIEGVMAYNHLKDRLKEFLQPLAQRGEAVTVDHIKDIFAQLRGDDQAIKDAAAGASKDADSRREQGGY